MNAINPFFLHHSDRVPSNLVGLPPLQWNMNAYLGFYICINILIWSEET